MQIDSFDCVSPLDFRYWAPDGDLRALLGPYVTERGRIASELMVEVAAVEALAARGVCELSVAEEVARAASSVDPAEIAVEEARIKHNIRALVNVLRAGVSEQSRPFIHLCLTSFDVIDTATAWRLKNAAQEAILPTLLALERTLIALALREKATLQMGRTHGQHAVPITFGFAIAGFVSRLGGRIEAIQTAAEGLRGKISGAVGAYNASALFFDDPVAFERDVCARLGLEPSISSTQIVEPEPVTDFLHALISAFGVLADLADDMRHLQRTEIAEVSEVFEAQQVGSSTMPHKRNPWNFENVKSFWKAFMPRMVSVYADQLSEHQRDLTNSASSRFLPEVIVALVSSARRMDRIMGRLVADAGNMGRNFGLTQGMIAAEPAYILLAAHGHPDAHEALRALTLQAQATGRPLGEVMAECEKLRPWLDRLTPAQRELLADPSRYTGAAEAKTEAICDLWRERLGL